MTSSVLNLNQTPEELNEVYRTNYYWYLDSPAYREAFLKPLGEIINRLGAACVDVGCGEGWLADYVTVPYIGFDGSVLAIRRAKQRHRSRPFIPSVFMLHVGRIERPTCLMPPYATIVFGTLLAVLVKPECYVEFLERYLNFLPRYFIVYDLERVDTSAICRRFELVEEHHASVDMPELEEPKRHRKIMVLKCK